MSLRDLISTASQNLWRSKLRTLLTVVAIFIGALTLTLTNGIGSGISSYIDQQLGNIGVEDMLIIQPQTDANFLDDSPKKFEEGANSVSTSMGIAMPVLTEEDIAKISEHDGILSAELRPNVAALYLEGPNGERFQPPIFDYFDEGLNLAIAHGSVVDRDSDTPQLTLSPGDQTHFGFKSAEDAVGKTIIVAVQNPAGETIRVEAKIAGVPERTLMSTGSMLGNPALIDRMYDINTQGLPEATRDQYFMATARFDTNLSEQEVKDLKAALKEQGYNATTVEDQIGIFKQVIDAIIMVLNFFAGIALLAASFGIVNTLLMAVQERTKEIGLMKAMGMGRRKVFMLFSIEAILLGFWGSLLGSLAGIGIGAIANNIASNTFLKDLVGFKLTSFPFTSVLFIMGLIMLIAFLAGTMPARRASKKDPIEALRTE